MNVKTCSSCRIEKPLSQFGKNRIKKDGLCAACKDCRNARKKQHYYANRDSEIAAARAWNVANPEAAKRNRRASFERNRERINKKARERYAQERDRIAAANSAWRKANPAKCREIKSRRRAAKLQRTPKWLTQEHKRQIFEIYKQALESCKFLGVEIHVDHIVPLQGKNVSGLHVPWNLQLLTGPDNSQKRNRLPEYLEGWRDRDGNKINS
jgi:5-methylcytosine-specific restriction endonuclease McrA